MALLDPSMFDPNAFQPTNPAGFMSDFGGMMGLLRQPSQGFPQTPQRSPENPQQDDALPPTAIPAIGSMPPGLRPKPQQEVEQGSGLGAAFSKFGDVLSDNSNLLMGLGAGFAGAPNIGAGISRALQMGAAASRSDDERKAQSLTEKYMVARGADPQLAAAARGNPSLMNIWLASAMKGLRPMTQQEKTAAGLQADAPWFIDATTGKVSLPEGYDKLLPKFEKIGSGETGHMVSPLGSAREVLSGGAEKPPGGFEWVDRNDPTKGLRPIAGGPAAQLPADVAGRVAMLETARPGVAKAKAFFLDPNFGRSPVSNVAGQVTNSGEIGRHLRYVDQASEAALRLATGAAATDAETKRYADFYRPSAFDSLETRRQKLDALERFVTYAHERMTQGRMMGPVPPPESFMSGAGDARREGDPPPGIRRSASAPSQPTGTEPTIRNPRTGQRMILRGGQWVPIQ